MPEPLKQSKEMREQAEAFLKTVRALNTFVSDIFQGADLSGAEIQEFLFQVSEEAAKLKPFFSKESEKTPSSPSSTELIFST